MNRLISLAEQLLTGAFEQNPVNPVIAGVLVISMCVAIVVGVLCKLLPASIDAASRLIHIAGRRRGQEKLLDALACHGGPDHLVRSLAIMNEPSPLDAPDAHLQVGPGAVSAIPHPRRGKKPDARMVGHDTAPKLDP